MCPACIANMALTAASVTGAGGLAAILAQKARPKRTARNIGEGSQSKRNPS
jgi:hypothetical protein